MDIPYSWIKKQNIDVNFPQTDPIDSTILITNISLDFFVEIDKLILKCAYMKIQRVERQF